MKIEEQNQLGGEDVDDDWVEFGVVELEEAMQRRKDPRSFSEIICFKQCLVGPSEKSKAPKIANAVNILMISFNVLTISYTLEGQWSWLVALNIGLGCLTQLLMWCV